MTLKRTRRKDNTLAEQVMNHANGKKKQEEFEPYKGNFKNIISTGSTLLDLAISGGTVRGGGIPSGILIEVFGPNGSGKTVFLCELAGAIQRAGGNIMFHDPEARLNAQFARMFDFKLQKEHYTTPDTVTEVFQQVRKWDVPTNVPNGIITDSLAALSTDMEMEDDDGDKMGMRRAKEFSQELRRTCRILKNKDYIMACSNQVRVNQNAGPYGQKYEAPGGTAMGFYASLRLRFSTPEKIKVKKTFKSKPIEKVVGVETEIEVYKSSVDAPYRKAPLIIYFDYGIDDIRANLQYVKTYSGSTTYTVNGEKAGQSLDDAVLFVEKHNLEEELREQVIDLWEEIQSKFLVERKKKLR